MSDDVGTVSQEEYDELKTKLDEFRGTNIKLMKQIEGFETKFKDVDLEAYSGLMAKQKALDDKKLIDAGKIDELVASKTADMQKKHAEEYGVLEGTNKTLTRQLEGLMIDASVRDYASQHGVASTAIDDVLLRAKTIFQLRDGTATPIDKDGNVIYQSGSTDPMTVEKWINNLTDSAPHLFTSSKGAGSQHGSNGKGGELSMHRADFDAMSHTARSEFAKKGGKVVD